MASSTSCSGASTGRTSSPENDRTAATVSKSSGSAIASVSVESSTVSGNERHCRRKRCERPSISGATAGAPSMLTSGIPSCSESAASTSRCATSPISTRIFPSLSPRSRCNSSARSRSSGSIFLRSISISPSRWGRGSSNACSSVDGEGVTGLFFYRGISVGQNGNLVALHDDLRRQSLGVLIRQVQEPHHQDNLLIVGQQLELVGGALHHLGHQSANHRHPLELPLVDALLHFIRNLLHKRRDSRCDDGA